MPHTEMDWPPALPDIDWAKMLAVDIIAIVHSNNFVDATRLIADHLRFVQRNTAEAELARLRRVGAKTSDEQFDYDNEKREGWTVKP